ncbi:MAG: DUF2961 domain-containing protein, partial [Bacteroidota bacterium]
MIYLRKTTIVLLLSLLCVGGFAQQTVTTASMLNEMIDERAVTLWPSYTQSQASSYDRRSVSPDKPGWFANDDHTKYIRTETN